MINGHSEEIAGLREQIKHLKNIIEDLEKDIEILKENNVTVFQALQENEILTQQLLTRE